MAIWKNCQPLGDWGVLPNYEILTQTGGLRAAIFKHESQKDRALFPGPDMREFWQRAEERNRETARLYDRLGLAEYEAIEGFVRWNGRSEP